ncbi:MAG TPA: type IVB secretion system apparatus protein IcmL/DotI [Gammaproteobacteria bacterium]|nr:type IVB secretion system apparatus protein IcmL/DotI [Gammaproteobacteria bacterium]
MTDLDFLYNQHRDNAFYRIYQPRFVIMLMGAMVVAMIWIGIVLYQVHRRPLPTFYAIQPNETKMQLSPQDLPNLAPESILKFAATAAVAAYTFDFVNYRAQIAAVRPYFTGPGWDEYQNSVSDVVGGIKDNKLFVSAVVSDPPIIANQDIIDGKYAWRVQVPLLVTYQSAQSAEKANYIAQITIIRIPTSIDPLGIGIDQFVM